MAGIATMLSGGVVGHAAAPAPTTYGLISNHAQPQDAPRRADGPITLGVRFTSSVRGVVSAVQYYQATPQSRVRRVVLWSEDGTRLASGKVTAPGVVGWRTVALTHPVQIEPNRPYVAAYVTGKGRYAADPHRLNSAHPLQKLALKATRGVYRLGAGFPTLTRSGFNYFVDVVFAPQKDKPEPTPAPTPPATSTATPTPGATGTPTPGATSTAAPGPATPGPASPPPATCATPTNPWGALEACGWPGPANTGVDLSQCPNGLITNSGSATRIIRVTTANSVVECQRITGSLSIEAKNVTVRNVSINYDGGGANGTGVIKVQSGASAVIDRVETNGLNHTHACIWHQGVSMSVNRMNCYGVNDGVFSWADLGYSATTGDNFVVANSYFHNLTENAANGHIDGYQTEGASHGVIEHNTYLLTASANSAIAIWNSYRSSSDIDVTGNLITGGGFSVYAQDYNPSETSPVGGASVTDIVFTNNTFSTRASGCVGKWGVWFFRSSWVQQGGPTDGWHRAGNRVLETGENVDAGNPHRQGVLCS